MRIRVLTLNVQHDAGDPQRTAAINAELLRHRPDIVVLQEVCYPARRDQLAELLAGTGLAYAVHQADLIDLPDATDGSALATRWPHEVVEVLDHRPTTTAPEHWWTLAATIELPEVGPMLLIQPTTPWRLDHSAAREAQLLAVADLDDRHGTPVPTIIAGDLNATPDSAGLRFLTGLQSLQGRSTAYQDAWPIAGDGPGHTWTTNNPLARREINHLLGQSTHHRRLDYILTATPRTYRTHTLHAELVGTNPILSDHYGVLADLSVEHS
ncbi:endonuclease/exonuclease/phosphatase family protein [Kribbella sp. NPDC020789]